MSKDEQQKLSNHVMQQIYPCWEIPDDSEYNDIDITLTLQIDYDPQGYPTKIELPAASMQRYETDTIFRELTDRAKQSVKDCAPLKDMPSEQYIVWQMIDMKFKTSECDCDE